MKTRIPLALLFLLLRYISNRIIGSSAVIREKDHYRMLVWYEEPRSVHVGLDSLPIGTRVWLFESLYINRPIKKLILKFLAPHIRRLRYTPTPSYIARYHDVYVKQGPETGKKLPAAYFFQGQAIGPLINKTIRRNLGVLNRKSVMQESVTNLTGEVVPMVGATSNNFGHFICENLPKLRRIEALHGSLNACSVVISDDSQWKLDLLEMVGMRRENIHVIRDDFFAGTMYVSDTNVVYMKDFDLKINDLRWVREKLRRSHGSDVNPFKNIEISRNSTRGRRIENEAECRKVLGENGFKIIDPGSLTIAEQSEKMASAHVVFGTVGAGLFASFFCVKDPTLIIASNKYFPAHMFHAVFNSLGYKIRHIDDGHRFKGNLDPEKDIAVDIENLEDTIRNRI